MSSSGKSSGSSGSSKSGGSSSGNSSSIAQGSGGSGNSCTNCNWNSSYVPSHRNYLTSTTIYDDSSDDD